MTSRTPHIDHLWQDGRWLEPLGTRYFRMDERDLEDMADFAVEFAQLLTLFDDRNQAVPKEQGWRAFFAGELSFLLARIVVFARKQKDGCGANGPDQLTRLADWCEAVAVLEGQTSRDALTEGFCQTVQNALRAEFGKILRPVTLDSTSTSTLEQLLRVLRNVADSNNPDLHHAARRVIIGLGQVARKTLPLVLNSKSDHPPHAGLFLSFLQLLDVSKAQLNQITERHLQYYYETVLGLSPNPPVPHDSWLVLTVSPKVGVVDLKKGTLFVTPPSQDGKVVRFANTADTRLSRTTITARRSIWCGTDQQGNITRILAFDQRSFSDGSPFFHPSRLTHSDRQAARELGRTGIAFSSPVLGLSQGTRIIELTLRCRKGALSRALHKFQRHAALDHQGELTDEVFQHLLDWAFLFSLSTQKTLKTVQQANVDTALADEDKLVVRLVLTPDFPPIEPLRAGPFENPCLQMQFNPSAPVFGYGGFAHLQVLGAEIAVTVKDLQNLHIGPGAGAAITKPVPAFAPPAQPGSVTEFSCADLDGKRVTSLAISIEWAGLPNDLEDYYAPYAEATRNNSFEGRFDLHSKDFSDPRSTGNVPLFTAPDSNLLNLKRTYSLNLLQQGRLTDPRLTLTLTAPGYGFGAPLYSGLLAATLLKNARGGQTLRAWITGKKPAPVPAPPPPVQPKIASGILEFNAVADSVTGDLEIWSLCPFHQPTLTANPYLSGLEFPDRSALFLDLEGGAVGTPVSVLFQLRDARRARYAGTLDKANPDLSWCYLASDGWKAFPQANVILDETENLSQTGRVEIMIPTDAASDQVIRLALTAPAGRTPMTDIVGLSTNAIRVTQQIEPGDDPSTGSVKPITQPENQIPGVQKIEQPVAASGGRAAESQRDFRTRVNERLRHKDRAICAKDYEQLILQKFPDIYEAKVFGPGQGGLGIVVAPTSGRRDQVRGPIVPLGRRHQIASYLNGLSAGWSSPVNVVNPSYEPVRLFVSIALGRDAARDDAVERIKLETRKAIAPWMLDAKLPMAIGTGQIDLGELRKTLHALPGVTQVTGLSLVQFYRSEPMTPELDQHGLKDTAGASAGSETSLHCATPSSVLWPDPEMQIELLPATRSIGSLAVNRDLHSPGTDQQILWLADPALIPRRPQRIGIGALQIGRTFTVIDPDDARPPSSTLLLRDSDRSPHPFA
ncbi:baseplate J/gp47 family protein [uncultured Ruegeria sp.]|uniref:baseplate J/gp47 family protein n=1 Tax=uncultured Ruegeria sp. TaxID=259304 RepID=UPI00260BA92E|nr:baseplate J/gp47 family protein [uncultured Ruegeria sp.]